MSASTQALPNHQRPDKRTEGSHLKDRLLSSPLPFLSLCSFSFITNVVFVDNTLRFCILTILVIVLLNAAHFIALTMHIMCCTNLDMGSAVQNRTLPVCIYRKWWWLFNSHFFFYSFYSAGKLQTGINVVVRIWFMRDKMSSAHSLLSK